MNIKFNLIAILSVTVFSILLPNYAEANGYYRSHDKKLYKSSGYNAGASIKDEDKYKYMSSDTYRAEMSLEPLYVNFNTDQQFEVIKDHSQDYQKHKRSKVENHYAKGYLSGNWRGRRTALYNMGIDTEITLNTDYWNVMSGGTKTGKNIAELLYLNLNIDSEELFGIENNIINISFIHVGGGDINEKRIGSVEGINNIEAGINSVKLYEAWTEHSFMNDKASILVGFRDSNADYMDMEMASNFMKPTMQVPQTVAGSGRVGPPLFPNNALGVSLKYHPSNRSYLNFSVFDGVPGNTKHPRGTHISLGHKDGAVIMIESGFTPRIQGDEERTPNKIAIGYWKYTGKQANLVTGRAKKINQGIYLMSSYEFYGDSQGRTLGAFFKTGISNDGTQQTDFDYELGLVGTGLIPIRKGAEIGIGFTEADNSDSYMTANAGANRSEYSFNAYYQDEVFPGVTLHPEFQYIVNPGTVSTVKNASIFAMRMGLNF